MTSVNRLAEKRDEKKKLLYLSPAFPPDSRVGALRPLKFVRHLDKFGYQVTVLTRRQNGTPFSTPLPDNIQVCRGWPSITQSKLRVQISNRNICGVSPLTSSNYWLAKLKWSFSYYLRQRVRRFLTTMGQGNSLSDMVIRGAMVSARRLFEEQDFDAILANVEPIEAAVVGAKLAGETGTPLLVDFRDPWVQCDMSFSKRHRLKSKQNERHIVETAHRVILNTKNACDVYRDAYPELPRERFAYIRNSVDPELFVKEEFSFPKGPFTLLFMGGVRKRVDGSPLFDALSILAREGVSPEQLRIVVSRIDDAQGLESICKHGLLDYIWIGPDVAYERVRSVMDAADMLVLMDQQSPLRIPAKTYDYMASSTPLLAITDNEELITLLQGAGDVVIRSPKEPRKIAEVVKDQIRSGPGKKTSYNVAPFLSEVATKKLAELLNSVS